MAIEETVSILRRFVLGDREALRDEYGAEAVAVAHDVERVLEGRLQAESAYASLWDAFEARPEETETRLIGALEAMIEADPALGRRLNAFVEEFHRAVAPPGAGRANLRPEGVTNSDVVPDTTVTRREKYSKGAGTYLYGNVKGGTDTLGEDVGVGEVDLGEGGRLRRGSRVVNVPVEFFGEVHNAVDTHPALEAADQALLHGALREIQAVLMEEPVSDLDQPTLRRQLEIIEERAPVIAEDLWTRLERLVLGESYTEEET